MKLNVLNIKEEKGLSIYEPGNCDNDTIKETWEDEGYEFFITEDKAVGAILEEGIASLEEVEEALKNNSELLVRMICYDKKIYLVILAYIDYDDQFTIRGAEEIILDELREINLQETQDDK